VPKSYKRIKGKGEMKSSEKEYDYHL